jgi:hypothetical protein
MCPNGASVYLWTVGFITSVILNTFVLNKIFLNEVSANLNTTYGDPLDVIGMTFIPLLIMCPNGASVYLWTVGFITESMMFDSDNLTTDLGIAPPEFI